MSVFILLISFLGFELGEQDLHHFPDPDRQPLFFGDPYILLHEGIYYMYGTSGDDGIRVYRSEDKINWEGPLGVKEGYALHKHDVWGDQWFWAPEVYFINEKFYMFFSAEEHINIAVSNSPLGPFMQHEEKPLLSSKAIDNHLFIDDDGKAYIYFVKFGQGLSIWMAEMNDDLLSLKKETMKECIRQSQPWEKSEGVVNEGPFVLKHSGKYYLFYSGNGYTSQDYGVGFAVADNPWGPWQKYENNPILQSPDTLRGVGHGAFFKDGQEKLYYVYHAHNSQEAVHPRKVYFNECSFVEQNDSAFPIPQILAPRFVPLTTSE